MVDRPILFSAPMVRALLDGRKTQTRRVAKITAIMGNKVAIHPPEELIELEAGEFQRGVMHYASTGALSGPYNIGFAMGDRLWVREAWARTNNVNNQSNWPGRPCLCLCETHCQEVVIYRADGPWEWCDDDGFSTERSLWKPSIHMPRWASRLTLTVTDVRVERLQDISEADAIAEGALLPWSGFDPSSDTRTARAEFKFLWDSINCPGAWEANPWVVVVGFTVGQHNIDAEASHD